MERSIPGELNALYYKERSSAGLIVSESVEVDPLNAMDVPARLGLTNAAQEAGWRAS